MPQFWPLVHQEARPFRIRYISPLRSVFLNFFLFSSSLLACTKATSTFIYPFSFYLFYSPTVCFLGPPITSMSTPYASTLQLAFFCPSSCRNNSLFALLTGCILVFLWLFANHLFMLLRQTLLGAVEALNCWIHNAAEMLSLW